MVEVQFRRTITVEALNTYPSTLENCISSLGQGRLGRYALILHNHLTRRLIVVLAEQGAQPVKLQRPTNPRSVEMVVAAFPTQRKPLRPRLVHCFSLPQKNDGLYPKITYVPRSVNFFRPILLRIRQSKRGLRNFIHLVENLLVEAQHHDLVD